MISAMTKIFSVCFCSSFNEKDIAFDFFPIGMKLCVAQAFLFPLVIKYAHVSMSCVHSVIISPTICSLPDSIKSKRISLGTLPCSFLDQEAWTP